MIKNQLLAVVMLLTCAGAWANGIRGKISDEQGNALVGATIRVENSAMGAVSDSEGNYVLDGVKGTVSVVASFVGYQSKTKEVDLNNGTIVNFTLEESMITYQDLIVKATRVRDNDPFAATTLTDVELKEKKAGEELPTLLNVTPSVVSFTENGTPFGNTAFRVRGTDPSRINITVDGVPINDQESQAVFWVNMTDFTESVKDIQIQRGVGTSTNGTAAFGASVNIQTNGYDEDAYGQGSITLGSFGTTKYSAAVNTGLIKDHFVFNARLSKLKSDGYIDYSGMDNQSYFVSGGYFSDKTKIRLKVFGNQEHTDISWWGNPSEMLNVDRTYNMAGEYYDKDGNWNYYTNQADNYWQDHIHFNLTQTLSDALDLNATLFYTKGKGYYEQFQDDDNWLHHAEYADYGFADAMFIQPVSNDTLYASDLTRQKWLDNDFYGANFSLNYKKEKLDGIFGVAANRYDGDHFGKILWVEHNPGIPVNYEWYNNHSIKDDYSAFVKGTYAFTDQLSGYADLQLRNIQYTMNGITDDGDPLNVDESYSFFNPKAGVTYNTQNHQVFASYAMANREPSRADLKEAAQDLTSLPKPETLHDFELGYTYRHSLFSINANAYYMLYKDQLVPTGEKNSVGYTIMTNVPDSYRAGVELAFLYTPLSWLKWEMNTTISQNKIIDFVEYNTYYDEWYWNEVGYEGTPRGNTNIAYSPGLIGSSIFTFYPVKGLTAALASKYVGEQYFDNTGQDEAKLDAYFVNDLSLAYQFPVKGLDFVELKFKVLNLFDADYISNAYGGKDMVQDSGASTFSEARWTYYFPQAFRNYLLQLNVRF